MTVSVAAETNIQGTVRACVILSLISVEIRGDRASLGGAGLGTLGFTEGLAREMTQQAGFVDFEKLDVDNPLNSYYVLRK